MANSTIGVRLSEDTQQRLEKLGKAKDRSPHYLMKIAIEKFLDAEEADQAEYALTLERWNKFELTGETISHQDVTAWAANLSKDGNDITE